MQDNSDQFATPEEEAAYHDDTVLTDDPVEETDSYEDDTEEAEEPEEESEELEQLEALEALEMAEESALL